MRAPPAFMISRVAAMISGPMPSPYATVMGTLFAIKTPCALFVKEYYHISFCSRLSLAQSCAEIQATPRCIELSPARRAGEGERKRGWRVVPIRLVGNLL